MKQFAGLLYLLNLLDFDNETYPNFLWLKYLNVSGAKSVPYECFTEVIQNNNMTYSSFIQYALGNYTFRNRLVAVRSM